MKTWNVQCVVGSVLLCLWGVNQIISQMTAPVFYNLSKAAVYYDGGYVLVASFWLVVINALRGVLLYNGWFLVSEGASVALKCPQLRLFLPVAGIPVCYLCANYFHLLLMPHFGVPAILTLSTVVILQILCHDVSRYFYKLLIQSLFILSTQWLDLIPILTPYGFGRGELSMAVKQMGLLFDDGSLLDAFSSLSFTFMFCVTLLLAALFVSYEKRIRQMHLLRLHEQELAHLKHHQARARLYQEMQYLVHDLKRPLTVVTGLADLLTMNPAKVVSEHARNILTAAEKMNQMISEIRNPDAARSVSVDELLGYTLSQIRPLCWGKYVVLVCADNVKDRKVHVNLIRLSRALVNLLENAWHATERSSLPKIRLRAKADDRGVFLTVEDNGPGFLQPEEGTSSSWGSSGLGLAFVKDAVKAGNGSFSLHNMFDGGVRCVLRLPEECQ